MLIEFCENSLVKNKFLSILNLIFEKRRLCLKFAFSNFSKKKNSNLAAVQKHFKIGRFFCKWDRTMGAGFGRILANLLNEKFIVHSETQT